MHTIEQNEQGVAFGGTMATELKRFLDARTDEARTRPICDSATTAGN